ncbi:MAG: hypothetical protein IPK64_18375 [bacterium]|nr:hypothetical protein [bacterium]
MRVTSFVYGLLLMLCASVVQASTTGILTRIQGSFFVGSHDYLSGALGATVLGLDEELAVTFGLGRSQWQVLDVDMGAFTIVGGLEQQLSTRWSSFRPYVAIGLGWSVYDDEVLSSEGYPRAGYSVSAGLDWHTANGLRFGPVVTYESSHAGLAFGVRAGFHAD